MDAKLPTALFALLLLSSLGSAVDYVQYTGTDHSQASVGGSVGVVFSTNMSNANITNASFWGGDTASYCLLYQGVGEGGVLLSNTTITDYLCEIGVLLNKSENYTLFENGEAYDFGYGTPSYPIYNSNTTIWEGWFAGSSSAAWGAANFTLQGTPPTTSDLTVNCGTGGASCTGNETGFETPANKSITATAAENYTFSNWTITGGNCTIAINNSSATTANFLNTTSACTVQANFIFTPVNHCYQEFANVSTACGGLSTGGYVTNELSPYVYINYTRPSSAIGATWKYKMNKTTNSTTTIPSDCFSQSNITLRFYVNSNAMSSFDAWGECYNGTAWKLVTANNTGGSCVSGSDGSTVDKMFDGNWMTKATWADGGSPVYQYCSNPDGNAVPMLFEEAMNWTMSVSIGSLSITCGPGGANCTGGNPMFDIPANVSITATPKENATFANWTVTSGNCTVASSTSNVTTVEFINTTQTYCTVQANFNSELQCGELNGADQTYVMNVSRQINDLNCFNITAPNVVLDCNGYSIIGNNASGTHGILSTAINTTVRNCIIENFTWGIAHAGANYSTLNNLTIVSSDSSLGGPYPNTPQLSAGAGVIFYGSSYNTLSNMNSTQSGLYASGVRIAAGSSYNTVNNINMYLRGVQLVGSSSSMVHGNNLSNFSITATELGSEVYGITFQGASSNILRNFTINGGHTGGLAFESDTGQVTNNVLDNFYVNSNHSFWIGYGGNGATNTTFSNFNMVSSFDAFQLPSPWLSFTSGNKFINGTMNSTVGRTLIILSSAINNNFTNVTFIGDGSSNLLDIDGSGNIFSKCNFTASTSGYYINDTTGGANTYNTSEGNIWADVLSGVVAINGSAPSSFPGLYIGFQGAGYPYNSSHSSKVTSGVSDYAPLTNTFNGTPTASLIILCGTGGASCEGNATNFAIPSNKSISAAAAAAYSFASWAVISGNCTIANSTSNITNAVFLNTTSSCEAQATFTKNATTSPNTTKIILSLISIVLAAVLIIIIMKMSVTIENLIVCMVIAIITIQMIIPYLLNA